MYRYYGTAASKYFPLVCVGTLLAGHICSDLCGVDTAQFAIVALTMRLFGLSTACSFRTFATGVGMLQISLRHVKTLQQLFKMTIQSLKNPPPDLSQVVLIEKKPVCIWQQPALNSFHVIKPCPFMYQSFIVDR